MEVEKKLKTDVMQALILEGPGCMTIQDRPIPEPGIGEILVKVESATTCGTDLKAFLRGHPQIPMPGVFGHEYSGTVIAAGENAKFSVGEEIMGVHSAPCQKCQSCTDGQENLCEHIMKTKVLGSYAEFLLIPSHIVGLNVFKKPVHVSWNRASLLEPMACVAHGIKMLQTRVTDRVLIIGPGAIGLLFVAALRALGVRDVTLLGTNASRLEVGETMGARPLFTDQANLNLGRGYDIVIECTGKLEVWERSMDYVRRGGHLMLFGGCPTGSKASFDTQRLHYDQISLSSPFHFGTAAVRQAKEWVENMGLPIDLLITAEKHLAEANEVFELLVRGKGIKYAFKP